MEQMPQEMAELLQMARENELLRSRLPHHLRVLLEEEDRESANG